MAGPAVYGQPHTMRLEQLKRSIWRQFPIKGLVIVALLILGLLGGLFHHHESQAESAACLYCHAGVQAPVTDLASTLVAPSFAFVATVEADLPSAPPRIFTFSKLIPRAPPVTTHPAMFWEGYVGLV